MAPRRSWTALLAVALAILALILARPYSVGPPAKQSLQRHPASHVIRVTAKLTFDGKPVEIDDLVDCKTTYRGTPTSTPHLTFGSDRRQIAAETPDGGAIVIRVSRSFCFVYGDTWGDMFPEFTPPEGWTPVIEWYDRRDPREAETGIIYLSETALDAENGRLRIVEPFRVAIPEHPASEALIAEAARQAAAQSADQDVRLSIGYRWGRMTFMLGIREEDWRNPRRAALSSRVGRYKGRPEPDFSSLAANLDEIDDDSSLVTLGRVGEFGSEDVEAVLFRLKDGRFSALSDRYERGIPKKTAERFGPLISLKILRRHDGNPFFPDFFDEYVPFTCVEGVMTPVPTTPGLIYWFRDRCSHADHFRGMDFFGVPIPGSILPAHGQLILDRRTRGIWWLHDL